MELQKGDWVQTEKGEVGRIILISRLSAFVEMTAEGKSTVDSYLASQLAKIAPPSSQAEKQDL